MNRPRDYDEVRVTARNLSYQCQDEHFAGMHMTGGVLSKGQIVWIRKSPGLAHAISAYVEGVGLVTVDPRFLVRAIEKDHRVEMNRKMPGSQNRPTVR